MPPQQTQSYTLPIAIVLGFGMIAFAIYATQSPSPASQGAASSGAQAERGTSTIPPVNETDFIRGNPNAPIVLIEYSDYDCPFCKSFHDTMNRIMEEYGRTGQVAWVYRHFPLTQLHPNAARIAEAAECVGDLAGNDAFWQFSDLVYDSRSSNQPTDMSLLPVLATQVGVESGQFQACVSSGQFTDRVQAQYDEAFAAGARGTPYTVVMVGGQQATISGAQPYSAIRQVIEDILSQLQGTESLQL